LVGDCFCQISETCICQFGAPLTKVNQQETRKEDTEKKTGRDAGDEEIG